MKPKKCGHYFGMTFARPGMDKITINCHDCGVRYQGRIKWRRLAKLNGKGLRTQSELTVIKL